VLEPPDSNFALQSFPGETATISGGVSLGALDWAPAQDAAAGVLSAPLPQRVAHAIAASTSLFAGRQRLTRARYPNGNAEVDVCLYDSDGGTAGCPGYLPPPSALPLTLPSCVLLNETVAAEPNRLPACCTHSQSDWCPKPGEANFHTRMWEPPPNLRQRGFGRVVSSEARECPFTHAPSGFMINNTYNGDWTNRSWQNPSTGLVHMFHGSRNRWGGWQFEIKALSSRRSQATQGSEVAVEFSRGGWQEGRGNSDANSFYIENIQEEVDVAGEYFLDSDAARIYLYPRHGDNLSSLVAPILEELLQVNGTSSSPVMNITVRGLQFAHTTTVFMKEYEYPLGSDWGIRRSAAVSYDNAHNSSIDGCLFDRVGGNAVLLSGNTEYCRVTRNEIAYPGESGVVLLGRVHHPALASAASDRNTVSLNHIHHIGIYGKQTSCVVQSVTSRTSITHNLCYAGPRAGFNLLDGYGGGSELAAKFGFAMVRETSDHGFFNSWVRPRLHA